MDGRITLASRCRRGAFTEWLPIHHLIRRRNYFDSRYIPSML